MSSKVKKQKKQPKQPKLHFWRPLMMREQTERQVDGGKNRLIGLELRMRDPFGQQEEIQMIPLNIEVVRTGNVGMPWTFGPHTLHTSAGDVTIPAVDVPASGL